MMVFVRFAGGYGAESVVFHAVRRVAVNGVEQEEKSQQQVQKNMHIYFVR